ncbi:MAG TPA: cadmium-translocating P-type ATPase [Clostridiales bacterium]|nr:cadmium-translocating P-type ATPase [Clostridiales bacterium]
MKKRGIKIIISAILFVLALVIPFSNEWINNGLFIISYLVVGCEILKKAVRNIFRGKVFDENFLMAVATIGAFAIGEFPEAVAVMLFYQVGELFQSYAVDKSRKSIASLMDIRPDYANIEKDGKVEKVDPDEVKIGDIIIVKTGEKIPLDGVVVEGRSSLDTMALTGESVPRVVKTEDEVLSGCINKDGLLKIRVTKEFGESTVSKILDLVENASSKKSKSENFITKFAKYYTPTVVIIAVLLAFIPPIILKDFNAFSVWLYKALSFLVVSCPCALVISIPLSFFGGIGGASKMGILIKGSNYLEALANTETVVFDKTGTLTEGIFEVQDIYAEGIEKDELLRIVAHAENYSNHPIAKSVKKAYNKEIDEKIIKNPQELSGKGIWAKIDEKDILVGNEKLMLEEKIDFKKCDEVGTILYVAIDKKYVGYVLIADKIKQDSPKTIRELKAMNIKETVMLTGDKKEVGEYVAKKLNMDKVYTELLPDGKVEKVEELLKQKSEKGKLVFVGDGINDAPVLTISDIGVAMGGLGSDAAIEAADIVIMTDETSKISKAINLSKKTMRIVRENIIFAIFVKIAVLVLTAFGASTMWEAVFADVGVSVIAIINALRMLNIKKFE